MTHLTKRETEILLSLLDDKLQDTSTVIADTSIKQKLDDSTTKLRGFTSELLQISDKLGKQPTGGSK